MKAIAVVPGRMHSAQVVDARRPSVVDVPDGRGVLVKVLRVGVDGTDREINEAMYGRAPEGEPYLILGHENFGRVEAVGPNTESAYPGWLASLLTHPVHGLDRVGELFEKLSGGAKDAIKVYCEVAEPSR